MTRIVCSSVLLGALGCSGGGGTTAGSAFDAAAPPDAGATEASSGDDAAYPQFGTDAPPLIEQPLDGGLIACDAGYVPPLDPCELTTFPLSGGISATWTASNGCGTAGGGQNLSWDFDDVAGGVIHEVVAYFAQPLAPGAIGPVSIQALEIYDIRFDGGPPTSVYVTPPGACTLTFTEDACSAAYGRILSGTGACTHPARSQASPAAPPVTIGPFVFTGIIP
jgi:hypothetical protein